MNRSKTALSLIVAIAILAITPLTIARNDSPTDDVQRAILVTGASSGIGLKVTEVLSASGTFVYAGARKQEDIDALNAMDNVEAVRLDVTIQDEIDAAVEQVREGGRGLYAVVNNAGVAILGPLVEIPESDLDLTFDVNVFGPYRITKAFLPLILESKGRVINISSVSGVQANMMFGTYSMSKHAVEAYTDILAEELALFGIRVIAIEPGRYGTNMGRTAMTLMDERGFRDPDTMYAQVPWERIRASLEVMGGNDNPWPEPDDVAYAVEDALYSDTPKEHYLVVSDPKVAEITIRKVIEELVSYNEDQAYSFDRGELIRMLDEELEGTRDAEALRRFGTRPPSAEQ